MQSPNPLQPRRFNRGFSLTLLFLTFLAQLLVHLLLGFQFLLKTDPASRSIALLDWQHLDQYVGWVALILLFLAAGPAPKKTTTEITRAARLFDTLLNAALAVGIALITSGVVGGGGGVAGGWFGGGIGGGAGGGAGDAAATMNRVLEIIEFATAGFLILAAAPISLRQLTAISRDLSESRSLTLAQLWRLVTVQWTLMWAAAEVYLRLKYARHGGLASIDTGNFAKTLLFALPAFGLLPNLLMFTTIACLQRASAATTTTNKSSPPRPRAWLVAFLSLNLGALCLTLGELGPGWLRGVGIAGTVPVVFAIIMYIMGFGKNTFRGSGRVILAGIALFLAGILMFAVERILTGRQIGVWREYTAAWHFLIGFAAPLVWLLGLGGVLLRAYVPDRLQSLGAYAVAVALAVLGALETGLVFALAGVQSRAWLSGVFVGATLLLLGCLIASAIALRTWRVGRQNFISSE